MNDSTPASETSDRTPHTENAENTAAPAPADAPGDMASLQQRIAQLEAELKNEKDKALRSQAEMINFRKRLEKERSNWHHMTVKEVVSAFLDPMDNLERTIDSATNTAGSSDQQRLEGLIAGVKMVKSQLDEVLERKGVVALYPKGEKFNPNEQESYSHVESTEIPEGHVVSVFRKGYKIGDTLVRTSTVQVAKAPAPAGADQAG